MDIIRVQKALHAGSLHATRYALRVTSYTLHVARYTFLFYHKGRKVCDFRFPISDFRSFFSTETQSSQSFTEKVLCLTVLLITCW